MNRLDLTPIKHQVKTGDVCQFIEPNIVDDAVFYADGEPIGFYLKQMPDKMCRLADIANAEFKSDNVPKSLMNRATAIAQKTARADIKEKYKDKRDSAVSQMCTLLGSIPPKPMVRRGYATRSSVHGSKSAQTFVKAMLMLAQESELLIKQIIPTQYERQLEIFKTVNPKWKFGNLFTSSISNYNISAAFHRDTGNIEHCVNVIICKRLNSSGGDLNVPDYGATIGQVDNSILVYPAWRNLHGVTPINLTHPDGYRNSLIFYPLKAFVNLPA